MRFNIILLIFLSFISKTYENVINEVIISSTNELSDDAILISKSFLNDGIINSNSFIGEKGFENALDLIRKYNLTSFDKECIIHGVHLKGEICIVYALFISGGGNNNDDDDDNNNNNNINNSNNSNNVDQCSCELKLIMPQSGQLWLLSTVPFHTVLTNDCNQNQNEGETSFSNIFIGTLSITLIQMETGRVQTIQMKMNYEDEGIFHIQVPENASPGNKMAYIQSFPSLSSEGGGGASCFKYPMKATSVWFKVNPFTKYNPNYVYTVEKLIARSNYLDKMSEVEDNIYSHQTLSSISASSSYPIRHPTRHPLSSLPNNNHHHFPINNRYVFATLLYDDSYLPGVLTLAASLKKVQSKYQLICIVPMNTPNKQHNDSSSFYYSSRVSVSNEALYKLYKSNIVIQEVEWLQGGKVSIGAALPSLGVGVWLKLRLWELIQYDMIVYLDADTLVLHNIDELFTLNQQEIDEKITSSSPEAESEHDEQEDENGDEIILSEVFGGVQDYFAGAFFTLVPNVNIFIKMMERLSNIEPGVSQSGRYVYGEQDFLNDFWRGDGRIVLDYRYHCLAEDVGIYERDPIYTASMDNNNKLHKDDIKEEGKGYSEEEVMTSNIKTMADTCKIIEFSSCDIGGLTGIRWKPWMDPSHLNHNKICKNYPSKAFYDLYQLWLDIRETSHLE